jgi:hypothetical protein
VGPRFRNTGKIARAQIIPPSQPSLFAEPTPGSELLRILVPGASTERYSRIWHVGRTEVEDSVFFGRLGFEGSGIADLWNEDERDFEEARTPAGVAAPFAIELSNLKLVFQTRGRDIRVTSFTGAMQGILRDVSGQDWRIETAQTEMSFRQWRATVERVTQMRFHLEPPNPNYQGRPTLQRLIEGAFLSAADITLHSDAGINTDADIVTELLDHVSRDYGRDVAVGERTVEGEVIESVYSSELKGETEVTVVPANPETGEVERDTLRRELTEPSASEHPSERG